MTWKEVGPGIPVEELVCPTHGVQGHVHDAFDKKAVGDPCLVVMKWKDTPRIKPPIDSYGLNCPPLHGGRGLRALYCNRPLEARTTERKLVVEER